VNVEVPIQRKRQTKDRSNVVLIVGAEEADGHGGAKREVARYVTRIARATSTARVASRFAQR